MMHYLFNYFPGKLFFSITLHYMMLSINKYIKALLSHSFVCISHYFIGLTFQLI